MYFICIICVTLCECHGEIKSYLLTDLVLFGVVQLKLGQRLKRTGIVWKP